MKAEALALKDWMRIPGVPEPGPEPIPGGLGSTFEKSHEHDRSVCTAVFFVGTVEEPPPDKPHPRSDFRSLPGTVPGKARPKNRPNDEFTKGSDPLCRYLGFGEPTVLYRGPLNL